RGIRRAYMKYLWISSFTRGRYSGARKKGPSRNGQRNKGRLSLFLFSGAKRYSRQLLIDGQRHALIGAARRRKGGAGGRPRPRGNYGSAERCALSCLPSSP